MQFVKDERLAVLSTANFFARLSYYLVAFVTSTFLAEFMTPVELGWVLAAISTAIVVSLIVMPRVFDRSGTHRVLTVFGVLGISVLIALTMVHTAFSAAILLALQGMVIFNIFVGLDLLLQAHTTDENKTGHFRSFFLVLGNISVLTATLIIAYIIHDHNYDELFLLSAAAMVPFTMLAMSLPSISHVAGAHTSFKRHTFLEIWNRPSLLATILAHFLLLVFFAWMTFYVPLYLYTVVGFSGRVTFLLMALSIAPYILFEYLVGVIADDYLGEKEMAFGGFVLLALGTACISFMSGFAFWPWAAVIFLANAGGAIVEASTETHFFKRVALTDENIISFYRMTRPLAAILAPALASLSLLVVPFQDIFIFFGIALALGLPLVLAMHDSK